MKPKPPHFWTYSVLSFGLIFLQDKIHRGGFELFENIHRKTVCNFTQWIIVKANFFKQKWYFTVICGGCNKQLQKHKEHLEFSTQLVFFCSSRYSLLLVENLQIILKKKKEKGKREKRGGGDKRIRKKQREERREEEGKRKGFVRGNTYTLKEHKKISCAARNRIIAYITLITELPFKRLKSKCHFDTWLEN